MSVCKLLAHRKAGSAKLFHTKALQAVRSSLESQVVQNSLKRRHRNCEKKIEDKSVCDKQKLRLFSTRDADLSVHASTFLTVPRYLRSSALTTGSAEPLL
ncbi:hypothetical protein NDU88_002879 [Pleurodeles waltl]|uniref:Uncharacterized protein n=1 Tax=Pleurodeles waltl TaxID=8319 RepID=A0AAV7P7X4_PLEWA|nr:hypothetical protein NDU88_002879 [Pleurodeles waltl]